MSDAQHDPHGASQHGHDAHGHDAHGHDEHEHNLGGTFFRVFIYLCALTATSFAVGNWSVTMDRPLVGWSLMMAISCAKALLVISFFMHLKWEANWKYVLTIPASIMSLFLLLMLVPDVGERTQKYSEDRQRFSAVPVSAEDDGEHSPGAAGH